MTHKLILSRSRKKKFLQKSIVWFCQPQFKINLERSLKSWKVNFYWKAVVTQCSVPVFLFTIFRTCWFIIKHLSIIFFSKWRSKSSKAKFCSKTATTHFTGFTLFSTISSIICPIIVLMSINYFLRNEGRNFQNRTFTRRQWTQYLLFLFFFQHPFHSIWSLLFDVKQSFSQKWRSKLSKANFCSKTVDTVSAVFVLLSTSFPFNMIIIVWCQTIIFSEMKVETLKSQLLLEDSGHSICCFCSSFNIFSIQYDQYCLMSNIYFLKNEGRNSQKRTFARRQ